MDLLDEFINKYKTLMYEAMIKKEHDNDDADYYLGRKLAVKTMKDRILNWESVEKGDKLATALDYLLDCFFDLGIKLCNIEKYLKKLKGRNKSVFNSKT